MVSLEAKADYWKPLRATPLVCFFIDFLDGQPMPPLGALDPADNEGAVKHLLTSVRDNDRTTAAALYLKLSTRRLRPDTEWVHNDYLVFALVCTVRKFQLDDGWLRQVIRLRPVDENEKRLVNKTFENILAGNHNAREDYHQISVVFRLMTDQGQPDAERLNKMVSHLWRHPFPWFESEFLTIVSMRAIRAAFEAKGLLNPEQRFTADQFAERFLERVKRLSAVIAWAAFFGVVLLLVFLNVRYADNSIVKIILTVVTVLTLIGSLTDLRRLVATLTERSIRKLLGYHFAPSSGPS
ncbi:hypothetical protein I2I05_19090 [Hymenobacter sp. BT683]|uniref:Uncharacterized protein n=1 Tax=Hymenobacter jeongseonensis TaxID=2791027 RepID=A0ABS0IMA6_9BACT|nr:hypothetical protein [Hymenobacter jeongseonensis]MBF9239507.1 hypothetical protein [Hymenobacter jeongseonensis]